ncbi:conserved hypothetical protein [Ricinus communis]|uniref:Uncharacterized protein n=1 Tax=Ricinus communis TaxID=3988 RepID=B9RU07_RICCO|nr:conserved hypothetical protein [Ricinus communis]
MSETQIVANVASLAITWTIPNPIGKAPSIHASLAIKVSNNKHIVASLSTKIWCHK